MKEYNAYRTLVEFLEEDEVIEGIVFGECEFHYYEDDEECSDEYEVPKDKQGVVLTVDEAKPYILGWSSFYNHPIYVWTNKRCIQVINYDGYFYLVGMPRNPVACMPC